MVASIYLHLILSISFKNLVTVLALLLNESSNAFLSDKYFYSVYLETPSPIGGFAKQSTMICPGTLLQRFIDFILTICLTTSGLKL